MKKEFLFFWLVFAAFGAMIAQTSVTGVSTSPHNKTVIMEEFTGVRCGACPAGKVVLDGIIAAHPTNFRAISMHPQNSSLTYPYSGDPNLQRTFLDVYYTSTFGGTSLFMPGAYINRRKWSNVRLQTPTNWATRVTEIAAEPSPVNLGILATYDSLMQTLDVTVEAYFTATVFDLASLYVHLSEDNITVQQQDGASGPFVQDLVFRESMTSQWGNPIATRTQGTLARTTYSYDNSTYQYDMHHANVIAYIENKTSTELYSGAQVPVTYTSGVGVTASKSDLYVKVVPNPFHAAAQIRFYLPEAANVSYTITSIQGQKLAEVQLGDQTTGMHTAMINAVDVGLAAGVYFLQVQAGDYTIVKRIVIQ